MTVITKPISGKKDDEKAKEAFGQIAIDVVAAPAPPGTPGSPVEAVFHFRGRPRRRTPSIYFQTFLLLLAILALCFGFMGALHIIRQVKPSIR